MRTLVAISLLLLGAPAQAPTVPAFVVALSHGADRQRDWRLSFFEVAGDGLLFGRNNELALALEREPQGLFADWPRGLVYLIEQAPPQGGVARLVAYAVDPSGFPFVFGKAELPGASADAALHPSGRFLYATGPGGAHCYGLEATSSLTLIAWAACPPRPPSGRSQQARLGSYVYDWTPGALRTFRLDDGGVSAALQERPFPRDRTVVSLVLLRPPD